MGECSEEEVKSFTGQFFQVFVYLEDGFQPRGLWGGGLSITYYGVVPPKELFCTRAMSPLPQGWEIQ